MKNIFYVLALLALMGLHSYSSKKQKEHEFEMIRYSFEEGCFREAINECPQYDNDEDQGECRERALKSCPNAAELFTSWLKGNK